MGNRISLFFLIATITSIPITVYSDEAPTPKQLVLLMKASCERYRTFEAKLKTKSYKKTDKNSEPMLVFTREIISRITKNKKKRFHRIKKDFSNDYSRMVLKEESPVSYATTYAATPKWSKLLVERSDLTDIHAYVRPSIGMVSDGYYSIHDALWDIFKWSFDHVNIGDAIVTHDKKSDLYILRAKLGSRPDGPLIILHIDPSKNYIPVKKDFLKSDGTLLVRFECSDFRQVKNGLWIPYRYSWFDPRENFSAFYKVEEAKVNDPIPDSLLDFAFPSGTIVHDEIANLRYRVDDEAIALDAVKDDSLLEVATDSNEGSLLKPEDIVVAPLAKEEDLLASASKTKELLDAHAGPKKSHRNIYYLILTPVLLVLLVIVGLIVKCRFVVDKRNPKT